MAVTPLRDGMNLVAKEFVIARTDEDGVLVLSEFAGALPNSMKLHIDAAHGTSAAYARAQEADAVQNDVQAWAGTFIDRLSAPRNERPDREPLRHARRNLPALNRCFGIAAASSVRDTCAAQCNMRPRGSRFRRCEV